MKKFMIKAKIFFSLLAVLILGTTVNLIAQTNAFEVKDGTTSLFLIDTNGDLTIKGKVKNGFAEMKIEGNSNSTSVTQNVWSEIGNFTTGNLSGWTFSSSALTATSGSEGTYVIIYSISFSGGGNDDHEIAISKNDVIQNNLLIGRMIGLQGDIGNAGGVGMLTISSNDVIKLEIQNKSASANPTIEHANVTIIRL